MGKPWWGPSTTYEVGQPSEHEVAVAQASDLIVAALDPDLAAVMASLPWQRRTMERDLLTLQHIRVQRQLLEQRHSSAADPLQEAWDRINALIVRGNLPGDGTDESAQRNGLVIATNVIDAMLRERRGHGAQA